MEQVHTLPRLPLCTHRCSQEMVPPPHLSLSPFIITFCRGSWLFPNITGPMTSSSQCNFSFPIPASGSWAEPYPGPGPALRVFPWKGDLRKQQASMRVGESQPP
ncbi:unnamed protein product [Rangifer tarandus platyrhynchus]|uniref:Uncharacterized protein n=1 Tax=Rangifer tarandus platyrhynchus TaxID=3082113 RepID=A0ABN8ZKD2_RANTA|nr:unnamed protein product [Rangifer tarandus platyrhynchus]